MKPLDELTREIRAEALAVGRAAYWARRPAPDYVPAEWLRRPRRIGGAEQPDVRPARGET